MKKYMKLMTLVLTVALTASLFTACGKDIPQLEEVVNYSAEELESLREGVSEEKLSDKWGEPVKVNSQNIWTVHLEGGNRYVIAVIENGKLSSLYNSQPLFVTVTDADIPQGLVDYNNYTSDSAALTNLPTKDIFGNPINYEDGDLYYMEFDGSIMETFPAQINLPYEATLMGKAENLETE